MAGETAVPSSPSATGGRSWLGQVESFVLRYAREIRRNKTILFWSLAFPLGFHLLSAALFLPADQIADDVLPTLKAIMAISYGTFGAVVVCLNAFGQHLVSDVAEGRYVEFRTMPISPSADLVGRLSGGAALAFLSFALVMVGGVATGATFDLRAAASIPVVLAAFVLMAVLWMVVSLVVAVVVGNARYTNIISLSFAFVLYFVTGFNGTDPASFAGDAELLNLLPNALPTRILVYHLVGVEDWAAAGMTPPAMPTGPEHLAVLLGYAVVLLAVGLATTRVVLYRRGVVG